MTLKQKRIEKKWSRKELSEKSGIKDRLIEAFEYGERDINGAKLKTLSKLALSLDVSISEILTDEETINLFKLAKK